MLILLSSKLIDAIIALIVAIVSLIFAFPFAASFEALLMPTVTFLTFAVKYFFDKQANENDEFSFKSGGSSAFFSNDFNNEDCDAGCSFNPASEMT